MLWSKPLGDLVCVSVSVSKEGRHPCTKGGVVGAIRLGCKQQKARCL